MKTISHLIGAAALCCAASVASAKPIIFDNDMAIDDWAALLYLAKHPDADIKAITISGSGETRCAPGLSNTGALLDLAKSPAIPYACGDDYPLDGYFVFPKAWRDDSDILSGVNLPATERQGSSLSAVDLIHHTLHQSEEPVTIIATGPLTNIAQWIERYPDDQHKVKELVIMGGNLDQPGNIIVPLFTKGHPNKKAEWNIFIDPLSAQIVFDAQLPITLVGLDATNAVKVTEKHAADFKKIATTPASKFWDQVLDKNDWFIKSGEYYFWDTLSVIVAMHDEFCEGESTGIRIAMDVDAKPFLGTSDSSMPATRYDGAKRNHLNAATAGIMTRDAKKPAIYVCTSTQPAAVFENFNQMITR